MPPRPLKHPVVIAPAYLAELRARVERGPGVTAVAKAARMSRTTLWGLLTDAQGRRATADAAERVRQALAKLEPDAEPPPPATVSVGGRLHHRWIAFGEGLIAKYPDEVEAALDVPTRLAGVVVGAGRRRPRRPR